MMKIKFHPSSDYIKSKILKSDKRDASFKNYVWAKTRGREKLTPQVMSSLKKEFYSLPKAVRKKYDRVKADGRIRIDDLKYKNGTEIKPQEQLAIQ